MRTTLTLEPDVAEIVEQEMRRSGKGMKRVVNDALRAGLATGRTPAKPKRFVVDAKPMGLKPGFDYDRMNQLVDQLEVEERARKLAQ